jgi:hypothetical protein
VHGLNPISVGPVERPPPVAADHDQTDVMKHAQVLRHGGLCQTKRKHDVADRPFAWGEVFEHVPATRLGDRVEEVGCGRGTGHEPNHIPTTEYVNQAIDRGQTTPAGVAITVTSTSTP